MTWMIDQAVFTDEESRETVFSYAHPIFWAPFTLIGDGGIPTVIR
jgi:CHAT domain-containing protein